MKGTHGGKREGAGRLSKTDEQKLVEELTPMKEQALLVLHRALKGGEQWAVKLWFEYYYGKPKQRVEMSGSVEANLPDWFDAE
jgi:hypothetical protein